MQMKCNCDTGPRMGGKIHDPGCAVINSIGAVMSFHDAREWVIQELDKLTAILQTTSEQFGEMERTAFKTRAEEIKRNLYW